MIALLNKYLALPNDNRRKTIFVTLALCLVCSILVSVTAVGLRPLYLANKEEDRRYNILNIGGLMEQGKSIDELFGKITARLVNLDTGEYVDSIDVNTFDAGKARRDPAMSIALAKDIDIATINRRANYATVYLVKQDDKIKRVILPVHGFGLWSTMYGFIALESDLQTVAGFGFYQHAETPGLGGEIDNPRWKAQWIGKTVLNEHNTVIVEVLRDRVAADSPDSQHQIDGLAGATLTARGVQNMLHFWLGEYGYRNYLDNLRRRSHG